jgi:hypothetical protein
MVRSDEHIAGVGARGHKPRQSLSFEVAGQQHSPAGGLNRHHEAHLIVGHWPRRSPAEIVAVPGMQHPHPTGGVERKGIAGCNHANWNPGLAGQQEQFADGGRVAAQEGFRHHDLTDRKPLDQVGDSVEMIGIGMGNHERVDMANPLVPEHSFHRPPRRPRRTEAAGVIHQAPARRAANHHATAMPHRRGDHPQPGRPRRCGPYDQAAGEPHHDPPAGNKPPYERLLQAIPRNPQQGGHETGVPADQPPSRWTCHPGVGQRQLGGHLDDGREAGERGIAQRSTCQGNRV